MVKRLKLEKNCGFCGDVRRQIWWGEWEWGESDGDIGSLRSCVQCCVLVIKCVAGEQLHCGQTLPCGITHCDYVQLTIQHVVPQSKGKSLISVVKIFPWLFYFSALAQCPVRQWARRPRQGLSTSADLSLQMIQTWFCKSANSQHNFDWVCIKVGNIAYKYYHPNIILLGRTPFSLPFPNPPSLGWRIFLKSLKQTLRNGISSIKAFIHKPIRKQMMD